MVALPVNLLNGNKPNQNGIDPNNPGNSVVISPKSSLLVNPNYGKLINRGPNIFIAFKISLYIEFLVDAWDIAGASFTLT